MIGVGYTEVPEDEKPGNERSRGTSSYPKTRKTDFMPVGEIPSESLDPEQALIAKQEAEARGEYIEPSEDDIVGTPITQEIGGGPLGIPMKPEHKQRSEIEEWIDDLEKNPSDPSQREPQLEGRKAGAQTPALPEKISGRKVRAVQEPRKVYHKRSGYGEQQPPSKDLRRGPSL